MRLKQITEHSILIFFKLAQPLNDGDVKSNPGFTQMINLVNFHTTIQRKLKFLKEKIPNKCDLGENINVNIASDPKTQNVFFFNTTQPFSLNIIKPWSVTWPSFKDSLQKLEFEVNNYLN